MLGALTTWLHGGDPLAPLHFEAPLARSRNGPDCGRYFENLIKQMLLDNPHRTTVTTRPDPELAARQREAEELRLAGARAAMSDGRCAGRDRRDAAPLERQETPDTPEALATVPMLQLADLDPKTRRSPSSRKRRGGAQVLSHDLFTSGIVYLDLGFDLHLLPRSLLPYVPLFSRALLQLGTETEDFVQLTQRIGRTTGGIGPQAFISTARGPDRGGRLAVPARQGDGGADGDLLAILHDILLTARLDNRERFRQLALEEKARLEAGLVPGGPATSRSGWARASRGRLGQRAEGGVSYLFFLRDCRPHRLRLARRAGRAGGDPQTSDRGALLANVTPTRRTGRSSAPGRGVPRPTAGRPPVRRRRGPIRPPSAEGLTIPAQVNYVGKAANLYALGSRARPASVVSQLPGDELAVAAGAGAGRRLRRLLQLRPPHRHFQFPFVPRPEPAPDAGRVRSDAASCASRRWTGGTDPQHHRRHRRRTATNCPTPRALRRWRGT